VNELIWSVYQEQFSTCEEMSRCIWDGPPRLQRECWRVENSPKAVVF